MFKISIHIYFLINFFILEKIFKIFLEENKDIKIKYVLYNVNLSFNCEL